MVFISLKDEWCNPRNKRFFVSSLSLKKKVYLKFLCSLFDSVLFRWCLIVTEKISVFSSEFVICPRSELSQYLVQWEFWSLFSQLQCKYQDKKLAKSFKLLWFLFLAIFLHRAIMQNMYQEKSCTRGGKRTVDDEV